MFSLTTRTALKSTSLLGSLRRAAPITVRYVGGHGSTTHDNDPEVLEREKHKNLAGKQEKSLIDNAPGWNDLLASASEAVVKAERAGASSEDLQQATVEAIHSRHSPDERPSGGSAPYKSDTIEGPLSTARLTQTTTTSEDGRTTTTKLEEVVTEKP